jgi:GNAT superfamily N-acetyltransferase
VPDTGHRLGVGPVPDTGPDACGTATWPAARERAATGPAYVVRQATSADLRALTTLRASWGASRGRSAGGSDDLEERLRRWWERQGGLRAAWLAMEGERPVGMVIVAVFERMPHEGVPDARWAYLANLWVEPDRRRRGVASALVAEAVDWARAEGMERVVLHPSEMSRPLYQALGFRPADDLVRLDL